jgi:hypothetical protein
LRAFLLACLGFVGHPSVINKTNTCEVGNWNEDLEQCQERKCGQTCERVDGSKERKGKKIKSQAMDWKNISTGGHRSNRLIIHEFRQVCKIGYIKIAGTDKLMAN